MTEQKPYEVVITGTNDSENRINDPIGPQDFNFKKLKIKSKVGDLDVKPLLVEFSFFEDIFSFAISGYLTVRDAAGYIELLQLDGNDTIEIQLSKTEDNIRDIHRTLRIYKIDNRNPNGNMTSEYYTIHFCSEELILSEQTKISKSFGNGLKISEMVKHILEDDIQGLKIDKKKKEWNIEETLGVHDFAIPYMKPFEAISWLSIYARPSSGVGADMLFFENNDGFNFRSLQSMYKQEPYSKYKYQLKNIKDVDPVKDFQEKWSTVLSYEMVKPFDVLNDINAGTYSNRLISIDPITRTHNVTDFNYGKYLESSSRMNKSAPISSSTNKFGETVFDSPLSRINLATSNAGHENVEYIKNKVAAAKDIFVENWGSNRVSQLNLANYTVLKIAVPGDPGLTVGKTIMFELPSIQVDTQNTTKLDPYYSGKYLITASRHVVQHDSYQTILEISKESIVSDKGYKDLWVDD